MVTPPSKNIVSLLARRSDPHRRRSINLLEDPTAAHPWLFKWKSVTMPVGILI